MSADTVALFLKKYGDLACRACPEVPPHIHAHMLRHTRAMHLYHQGMPMMLLSEYLGHASDCLLYTSITTNRYGAKLPKDCHIKLKKPAVPVTEDNWKYLQFIDLTMALADADVYKRQEYTILGKSANCNITTEPALPL